MPWKSAMLPLLDEIDESASTLAACNTVFSDTNGRLVGFNFDWRGVAGALQEGRSHRESIDRGEIRRGLVIGAGGAARAAVYALWKELSCEEIYILNRDDVEVADLLHDVQSYYTITAMALSPPLSPMTSLPSLIHVTTAEQASAIKTPDFAVGTVPDLEPKTAEEQQMKALLTQILEGPQKGVLLDMCYKPPRTRHIAIAEKAGWRTVEGWRVIGHQAQYQWQAWAGEKRTRGMEKFVDGMWRVLRETVSQSPAISGRS